VTYYDRFGYPISRDEWARLFELDDYKRVAWDAVAETGVEVSTVWLGLDHNHDSMGPPIIFETMIFGGDHDQRQWRYSHQADAVAGHIEACRMVGLDIQVST
jgi:hypothetical protein